MSTNAFDRHEVGLVTEFWYRDQEALDASIRFARSEEGQVLARDEENFMDRPSMRTFVAHETQLP